MRYPRLLQARPPATHGPLLVAGAIALLTVLASPVVSYAAASTHYAVTPAAEPTVDAISTAVDACIHHSGAYTGPAKIKAISVLGSVARADVSLGVSGDSFSTVILERRANAWVCAGGGGGVINARNLRNVHATAAQRNALINGDGLTNILARPIYLAAPQHSIFVIQTPGH